MYSSGEEGGRVAPELWACDGPVDASAVALDAIVDNGRWLALEESLEAKEAKVAKYTKPFRQR